MRIRMTIKKQLLTVVVLFSFAMVSQAQCLPTDTSCDDTKSMRQVPYDGFDPSLEVPPQFASEELNVPEVIQGSDWVEQNSHVFIPSGSPSWGAIARDSNLLGLNGLGVSDNWISERDAAWSAVNLCRQNGGKDCDVELTYYNACLAVAVSEKGEVYWLTGVTRDLASQKVMQLCADKRQGPCRLPYARCSYPAQ